LPLLPRVPKAILLKGKGSSREGKGRRKRKVSSEGESAGKFGNLYVKSIAPLREKNRYFKKKNTSRITEKEGGPIGEVVASW